MEEKKKLWEKKWFAIVMLLVAPVVIFSVISLLVKDTNSEDVRPSKYVTKDESRKQSGSVNDTEKESKADKVVAEEDGVKVSSFVATVKKPKHVVKEEPKAVDTTPEPTPVPEPAPAPTAEPLVEPSTTSSADKQIAAEIDAYVNPFLPSINAEGVSIQREQIDLMVTGSLTSEGEKKVKSHLIPRIKRLAATVENKKVSGEELRAIHAVLVAGERSKSASLEKYLRAYAAKDEALAQEANAEIMRLTGEYEASMSRLNELVIKYGVTLRY